MTLSVSERRRRRQAVRLQQRVDEMFMLGGALTGLLVLTALIEHA